MEHREEDKTGLPQNNRLNRQYLTEIAPLSLTIQDEFNCEWVICIVEQIPNLEYTHFCSASNPLILDGQSISKGDSDIKIKKKRKNERKTDRRIHKSSIQESNSYTLLSCCRSSRSAVVTRSGVPLRLSQTRLKLRPPWTQSLINMCSMSKYLLPSVCFTPTSATAYILHIHDCLSHLLLARGNFFCLLSIHNKSIHPHVRPSLQPNVSQHFLSSDRLSNSQVICNPIL